MPTGWKLLLVCKCSQEHLFLYLPVNLVRVICSFYYTEQRKHKSAYISSFLPPAQHLQQHAILENDQYVNIFLHVWRFVWRGSADLKKGSDSPVFGCTLLQMSFNGFTHSWEEKKTWQITGIGDEWCMIRSLSFEK